MNSKFSKLLAIALIPVLIYFIPAPAGLDETTWTMLGIYLSAIVGIILRPFPEPVMMIIVIGVAGLLLADVGSLLSGYANGTVWLVFAAFAISQAFVQTGLGKRLSYVLIGKFGRTTLGLGYVLALTDGIISPATPSATARSGGIVYPVFRSIAETLGSPPEEGRKLGSYLTILTYHVSMSTAAIFLTAMAPNAIIAQYANDILGVDLSWMNWAVALGVPAVIVLLAMPYLLYKFYAPEIKEIPNYKEISKNGLDEMGPISRQEKLLALYFVIAVILWSTGSITGFDGTAVALTFLAASFVSGILNWNSILELKGAWSTLIWYGGIIGISGALSSLGFFKWLADTIQANFSFEGLNMYVVLLILVLLSLVVRYIFASVAAYVASFIPVLYTLGLAAGVPPAPLALLIAASAAFGSLLTHYGGAVGPVLFGTGYIKQNTWWKLGGISVAFNVIVYMTIGLAYWKLIGLW